MASLLLELSQLEVEPLGITVDDPEQERKLDTLVHSDTAALLLEDDASHIVYKVPCCCTACGPCGNLCGGSN